jgi:hypothetical protein
VKPRLRGEAYLVRYLDDFVVCFQYLTDAERFQEVLIKRLARFSLELELSKTKLLEFGRFEKYWRLKRQKKAQTFSFLGFGFFGLHLPNGTYLAATVVDGKRRNAFMNRLKESMRRMRHSNLLEQRNNINIKLRGYFNYFAVPFNSKRLNIIRFLIIRYWRKLLSSRSQNGKMNWQDFNKVLKSYPIVRPMVRFSNLEFSTLWQS